MLIPLGAHGVATCGAAGTGWQTSELDDRSWLPAQRTDAGTPGCLATRFERWHFTVAGTREKPADLAALTLRLRYQHGFAAYLNGVEIARRRLPPDAPPQALATEPHGLELESLTVPLRPGILKSGDNLLAIEVHPRSTTREPVLDVELSAQIGARVLRGPYLQNPQGDAMDVLVDTDLPTTLALTLAPEAAEAGSSAERLFERPSEKHHVVHLDRLEPGTRYRYRAVVVDERNNRIELPEAVFHTPPEAGRPLRFILYGDVRSGHDIHGQLNHAILDEDPDFILITGDLVDAGSDDGDWEKYFDVAAPLIRSIPVFPAPGNHEYARLGRGRARFYEYFRALQKPALGYLSSLISGLRFISIDSNEYKSSAHLDWLTTELAEAKRRREPAFVFAHEGPYSTGLHGDNTTAITYYVPILERYGVAMMMYGHDHHYERGRVGKLNYVVSGGGGAELRIPRCTPGSKCAPRILGYANEHHYVVVEVAGKIFRVCPKRLDGSAIEPCATYPLRQF